MCHASVVEPSLALHTAELPVHGSPAAFHSHPVLSQTVRSYPSVGYFSPRRCRCCHTSVDAVVPEPQRPVQRSRALPPHWHPEALREFSSSTMSHTVIPCRHSPTRTVP